MMDGGQGEGVFSLLLAFPAPVCYKLAINQINLPDAESVSAMKVIGE